MSEKFFPQVAAPMPGGTGADLLRRQIIIDNMRNSMRIVVPKDKRKSSGTRRVDPGAGKIQARPTVSISPNDLFNVKFKFSPVNGKTSEDIIREGKFTRDIDSVFFDILPGKYIVSAVQPNSGKKVLLGRYDHNETPPVSWQDSLEIEIFTDKDDLNKRKIKFLGSELINDYLLFRYEDPN